MRLKELTLNEVDSSTAQGTIGAMNPEDANARASQAAKVAKINAARGLQISLDQIAAQIVALKSRVQDLQQKISVSP